MTNHAVEGQKSYSPLIVFVLLFGCVGLLVGPASAQQNDSMEEVVVQAEESDNALINELGSVSVLDAEKLADAGIENVEDVAQYVPNLSLTQTETGTNICVRGICAGTNQGFDQSVGIFSDGVPLPRGNMARAPFLDLAGVQVYRGPQYVLDGNYAIAGSLHLISNLATDEFKAGFDFNYVPSQDDRTMLITVGGPISDQFAANLVFQRKVSDGYVENVFKNEDEAQREESLLRLVLGYTPNENLSFKLKTEIGSFDTEGRAAEIILDQATPDPTLVARGEISTATRENTSGLPAAAWVQESDFLLASRGTRYDVEANAQHPNYFQEQTYAYAGRSYTDKLAEIYRLNDVAVPVGLTDTQLDFKRSSDGEEFSENDSLNVTLVSEWSSNDHRLTLTNSYIDYEFAEVLDTDFLPAKLISTEQQEEYSQLFNSLKYQSPRDEFIEIDAGLWHMESELRFNSDLFLQFTDRVQSDGQEFETVPQGAATSETEPREDWQRLVGFFENESLRNKPDIARAYFGAAFQGGNLVVGGDVLRPTRLFEQDQKLFAGYVQTKINWASNFRTILGGRYTYSEKEAVRDVALVFDDGSFPSEDINGPDAAAVSAGVFASSLLFGLQVHSCRNDLTAYPQATIDVCIQGVRREEAFLPSITTELDVGDLTFSLAYRQAGKLGGFDARANSRPDALAGTGIVQGTFEFEEEEAGVYELGMNWFAPNGSVLNATAFYTDYKDLQVSRSDGRTGSLVDNAGAASNTGVELEGLLQLTDSFNINYSVAYIDFQFDEFEFGSCHLGRRPDYFFVTQGTAAFSQSQPVWSGQDSPLFRLDGAFLEEGLLDIVYDAYRPQQGGWRGEQGTLRSGVSTVTDPITGVVSVEASGAAYPNARAAEVWENAGFLPAFCDFKGQTNQYVADWSGTFSFNYETNIAGRAAFRPTLDVIYNSGYFTDSAQDPLGFQDEFFLFNGRLEVASLEDVWTVALTGQNLTNEKVISYSNNLPVGSGFQGARGLIAFVRPPRSIGLNVRYNFY